MKFYNKIQILKSGDLLLDIDRSLQAVLGLRDGTMLTGFALGPRDDGAADGEGADAGIEERDPHLWPNHSFVLSPFPLSSWGRLLRASLTCTPAPGALYKVHIALRRLGLICHYTEATNGLDLNEFKILSSETEQPKPASSGAAVLSNLIIPSMVVFFEVVPERAPYTKLQSELLELTRRLHDHALEGTTERKRDPHETVRQILEKRLQAELESLSEDSRIESRVDWVSPMETLNRLARWRVPKIENPGSGYSKRTTLRNEEKPSEEKRKERNAEEYPLIATIEERKKATLLRARARKKVLVRVNGDDQCRVSLSPWQRVIWPLTGSIPDEMSWETEARFLALGHADSNEKVLVWDLFRSPEEPNTGSPIVTFEFLYPAGLLEPCWWQWVFGVVHEAGGNILTSSTSGRQEGHWASLEVTAAFPVFYDAGPGDPGDISNFVHCFRTLQGREGLDLEHPGTLEKPSFERLLQEMAEQVEPLSQSPLLPEGSKSIEIREASTLRNITVWDPRIHTVQRAYSHRFKPNPFSFTQPLNQERYDQLYPDDDLPDGKRTRDAMAKQIIERIRMGENVAIVGAHRSGKTSVLNLVHNHARKDIDEWEERGGRDPGASAGSRPQTRNGRGSLLIPLTINAALVPPQALFPEIAIQLHSWAVEHSDRQRLADVARKLGRGIVQITTELLNATEVSAGPVTFKPQVDFSTPIPEPERDLESALRQHLWTTEAMNADKALDFMSRSLGRLQAILKTVSEDDPANGMQVRVLVIVDEIGRLTGSEFKPILQGWRHVIESSDFDAIRWLISASRPIQEDKQLSPITNVFKEYNVGSLRKEEAQKLLRIFGLPQMKEDEVQPDLRPVLTYNASVLLAEFTSRLPYFLQVVCYHLYDRSTRSYLPIINRQMCKQVIRRDVLPEVSDYLEYQWDWMPAEVRERLERELADAPSAPMELLSFLDEDCFHTSRYPASYRKALLRAGLKGDDDTRIVAPIVALWLASPEAPHSPSGRG